VAVVSDKAITEGTVSIIGKSLSSITFMTSFSQLFVKRNKAAKTENSIML
jgi:hypothetical protein